MTPKQLIPSSNIPLLSSIHFVTFILYVKFFISATKKTSSLHVATDTRSYTPWLQHRRGRIIKLRRYSDWTMGRTSEKSSFDFRQEEQIFSPTSKIGCEVHAASYAVDTRNLPGITWPLRESDHSPPPGTEAENTGIHTSISTYTFTACTGL